MAKESEKVHVLLKIINTEILHSKKGMIKTSTELFSSLILIAEFQQKQIDNLQTQIQELTNKIIPADIQTDADKGYEKFLNNPEEYIEKTRNASEDKEVEDAAHQYSCMKVEEETPYTDSLRKDTSKNFKAGAEWQKEQSANDAIELLNWLRDDETDYFLLTNWIQTKKSSKEVYELWQKSKNK
jgi:hypothetical protein